jgi:hypothetical protein
MTSLPLNLPPRYESFERGRALLGMNTTHPNPTVKDTALWKQHITTSVFPPSSTLSLSGFFSVSFSPYGTFTSHSTGIAFDATAEDFKMALESIDGIGTLEVSRQDCDNPSITCTWDVAFIDFIGKPNLLEPDYSRLVIK